MTNKTGQTRATKKRRITAVTLTLTLLLAFGPTHATNPASPFMPPTSANADELDQTLDPNQAQGTGQHILDQGHVDFGPTLATGAWKIQIHDDTQQPSFWRNPEDVVLHVKDTAKLVMPQSNEYSFLGVKAGKQVWVIPQTQKNDVVWAGWNTQEPQVLETLNRGATMSVLGVEGPGTANVYLQSGNFQAPQPLWSSTKPFPQKHWIDVNTHTHANWVFTEPGIYLIEIEFAGELITGQQVTSRDTLRFAVGDQTPVEEAFTKQLTNPAADETAAKKTADTKNQATQTGKTGQESAQLEAIVWTVAATIALALIAATITVTIATRRAKKRALASRKNTGRNTGA